MYCELLWLLNHEGCLCERMIFTFYFLTYSLNTEVDFIFL